ncbi:hypothetical protein GCM10009550_18440 [Actinocorallia libanotica]|uniref:Uncharacterized protein n=1 Tax=Actinocorallia libanotica TaxID=46162 RepID=A0ABP4B9Z7_9ACTN
MDTGTVAQMIIAVLGVTAAALPLRETARGDRRGAGSRRCRGLAEDLRGLAEGGCCGCGRSVRAHHGE